MQLLANQANRRPPELRTHDPAGHRIDEVEYHPAYHELMQLAFGNGLHSLAWTAAVPAGSSPAPRSTTSGTSSSTAPACPVTMTFASVQVLRTAPALACDWEPKILAPAYDPRPLPIGEKFAATIGMAMTEKQGGSDLRANQTRARRVAGDLYELRGPQVVLLGADVRRLPLARAPRRRAHLLLRPALARRRDAQPRS